MNNLTPRELDGEKMSMLGTEMGAITQFTSRLKNVIWSKALEHSFAVEDALFEVLSRNMATKTAFV